MSLRVVPDVVTAEAISLLIYQYIPTHTCVPGTHDLSQLCAGSIEEYQEFFLHFRTQQTRVGNALSNITNLTSGVIQGSVLWPLYGS